MTYGLCFHLMPAPSESDFLVTETGAARDAEAGTETDGLAFTNF